MGTPAEVLQAFWQELRGRTRVTIDHPELPEALKDIAAGAVQTNEAATGELAALRAEARHAASVAEAERDAARTETVAAREEVVALWAQLAEAREAHDAVQATWPRSAMSTPQPRPGWKRGGRNWTPPGGSWRNCTQFSTELERAREQVTLAPRPASGGACANRTPSVPRARRVIARPKAPFEMLPLIGR
ncbi:hypothetical protein D9M68_108530 [compost metagenome]